MNSLYQSHQSYSRSLSRLRHNTAAMTAQGISPNGAKVIITTTVVVAVATVLILLRFVARRKAHQVAIDDWVSLLSYVLLISVSVCHYLISGPYGYAGTPMAEFDADQLKHFLIMLYADNICYACCTAAVKMSVTLLYRRIFVTRPFKIITSILVAVLLAWMVAVVFTQAFSCDPVRGSWIPTEARKCIDSQKFYNAVGISNIIFDFTLLLLPLPMVWQLQMNTKRKIQVSAVFLVGAFVCICSVLRLVFLQQLDPNDAPGTIWIVGIWTITECAVGVSCACMPPLAHLFKTWHQRTTMIYKRRTYASQPPESIPSYGSSSRDSNPVKPMESHGYLELS
ncbi:hypothetical protein GGR52DRAFT_396627 [Hypoxylon sp. FL1284]|nr:hypothetical protein GGR52DRAFT_396627 [Hypoxylon sp. FL1284]